VKPAGGFDSTLGSQIDISDKTIFIDGSDIGGSGVVLTYDE
jgi:hypothetical protein